MSWAGQEGLKAASESLLARQDIQPYMQMLARTRTHSAHELWFQLNLGWVVSVYCYIPFFLRWNTSVYQYSLLKSGESKTRKVAWTLHYYYPLQSLLMKRNAVSEWLLAKEMCSDTLSENPNT